MYKLTVLLDSEEQKGILNEMFRAAGIVGYYFGNINKPNTKDVISAGLRTLARRFEDGSLSSTLFALCCRTEDPPAEDQSTPPSQVFLAE